MTWREANGWWPNEAESTFGMDLFMGEEDQLGRGIGTQTVKKFVCKLFKSYGVTSVVIDVDPGNRRAFTCYSRAGFLPEAEVETPDGHALIMRFRKPKQ